MGFNLGETIGDYRVVELLGSGGMGSVYRVKNLLTDREEAMKVLLPDLRTAPELAERFGREIKIHASLDHPHIASLRTAIRVDNQLLMIMELVEGVSLETRLRESSIELWRSVDWLLQVLSALAYAHERGVIHRDIKPANIMLTRAETVKLTDFGVASVAAERRLTRTGMAIGSLHYMSPEQIQAGPVDARSDIYSVGVTFYEMLTRRRPFTGASEYELMKAHLEGQATPIPLLNPAVPYPLSVVAARAISRRPEDRFQTAREFKSALESAGESCREFATEATNVAPGFRPFDDTVLAPSKSSPAPPPRERTPNTGTLDPTRIERVKKELAQYIGPMARILVDRALRKSVNLQQLYDALAAEIPNAEQRDQFLTRRPR
ncbi:MAG TPA: serine/threonine-protein kinase [Bryobacteraceae bacterium]|nr:serine/threonine-protein kinase [Bryobacteraceae bacterium]